MAHWKRPVRSMVRWFRLHSILPDTYPRWFAYLKIMSGNAFISIILSIVPGLAHLAGGRFREVRWFVLGWLLLLLAGIFFYCSNLGLLLLGLAVGLHGWIAYSHTLMKESDEMGKKIFDLAMLIVIVGLPYFGIRHYAFGDFVFGYTNLTIPYQNVQTGDLLLARHSLAQATNFKRGSLVLSPVVVWGGHGPANRRGPLMVGQIVALPGEEVAIDNASFVVEGHILDDKQFPVPQWLRKGNIGAIQVPAGSYFISTVYNVNAHGMVLDAGLVGNACVVHSSRIEGKAIMNWLPLARRGFLRAGE
ncbi:MAG: hypothetical protein ABR913_11140 [Sedimentisphaerales bacterium]